jgi:hypothetical protein
LPFHTLGTSSTSTIFQTIAVPSETMWPGSLHVSSSNVTRFWGHECG